MGLEVNTNQIVSTETAVLPALDAETLLEQRLTSVTIQTHGGTLERKSIETDAGLTRYTVMKVSKAAEIDMLADPRFFKYGIEADGILINQAETSAKFAAMTKNAQVGLTPEQHLSQSTSFANCLAHYVNHYGWQKAEALIVKEKVLSLPDDEYFSRSAKEKLVSSALCYSREGGWEHVRLELDESSTVPGVDIGFTLPMIVENGRAVPINNLLSLPRFMADPRNGINFTPDPNVNGAFFPSFREGPLMLIGIEQYQKLFAGETLKVSGVTKLTKEGLKILKAHMTPLIKEYLAINLKDGITYLNVKKPLPKQSIPAFLVGLTRDRSLITIAVDGRQKGRSAGATFTELQEIAVKEGMYYAGFGPAGNDVVNLVRSEGETWYASAPSGGSSRPLPAVLRIRPGRN